MQAIFGSSLVVYGVYVAIAVVVGSALWVTFMGTNWILIWAMAEWGWLDASWQDEFLQSTWFTDNYLPDWILEFGKIPFE